MAAYRLNRNGDEAEAQIRRLWQLSMKRTDALLDAMWKDEREKEKEKGEQ